MNLQEHHENIWSLRFLLKGANLQGVKMLCSNAEGASLKGCNFEDPSGLKANLEGNPSQFLMNVEVVSHL